MGSVVNDAVSGVCLLPELPPIGDRAVAVAPEPSSTGAALRTWGLGPCCGDCCGVALVIGGDWKHGFVG